MNWWDKFDHLVIETTSIADPAPVIQTFLWMKMSALMSPTELEDLEGHIRGMNAMAKIYRTQDAQVEIDQILGVQAFNLDRALTLNCIRQPFWVTVLIVILIL
jgi:G3E family GTPase